MENKRFLTVQDVMEMLDVSLSYAYKLIRRLNAELEAEGFVTIKGRVSTQYFLWNESTDCPQTMRWDRWRLSRTKRPECGRLGPIIRI